MAEQYNKAIELRELEIILADIETADSIFNKSKAESDLRCISAYHYTQAIEKALKAIVKVDQPVLYYRPGHNGRP